MEEVVDILVTTYNTNEKFLKKQIESILKQTYKNIQIYYLHIRYLKKEK